MSVKSVSPSSVRPKVRRVGLPDRGLAWLFVGPAVLLLLAFNIFPLLWTLYLSFTNFRANRPTATVSWLGNLNYQRILGDPEIWQHLQKTAAFLVSTLVLQLLLGFALAWFINRKFRTHAALTTFILLPMMLSPAVVGTFWTYFFQPQYGLFNQVVGVFGDPSSFSMLGDVKLAPWAIVLVDTWMWTPYVMLLLLAGLRSIPDYIFEAAEVDRASEWTKFWRITLPMMLPFVVLAVLFRVIENFKMFDLVNQLTNGGPGSTTELASITLKREAFEKWRTGFASAFAIILFVSIYGLASVLVKFLERVRKA